MLTFVATPIGNLADMTFRAVAALKEADVILCEDTRHSLRLLEHYDIRKPLMSFHRFNEAQRTNEILELLKEGKQIALITDAGTPGIADPGQRLAARCHQEGLAVTTAPGPCAAIAALSLSGFDSSHFHFIGFLPKATGELRAELLKAVMNRGTTIGYESPHRVVASLQLLHELDPHAVVGVAREMTKQFESFVSGSPEHVAAAIVAKGEIVLLIAGNPDRHSPWLSLSPTEHVRHLMDTFGLSAMEGIRLAADQRGVPKREVYRDVGQISPPS